jgi:endonuclease YncB( thermonuclease family)
MRFLVAFVLVAPVVVAHAASWSGRVVGVKGGDTITVLRDGERVRVTVFGVECPGRRRPFGAAAKKFTQRLLGGETVTVSPITEEKRGRVLAKVAVRRTESIEVYRGGRRSERRVKVTVSVADELLKAGMARVSSDAAVDKRLLRLEARAKAARQGLWAGPGDPFKD